jgi:hypothetical protein
MMKDSRVSDDWLRTVQSCQRSHRPRRFNSGPVRLAWVSVDRPFASAQNPSATASHQATIVFPPIANTQAIINAGIRIVCKAKSLDRVTLPPDMGGAVQDLGAERLEALRGADSN